MSDDTSRDETFATITERLNADPAGLHRLNEPSYNTPSGFPRQLAELCRQFDGAELFHESVVLFSAADIVESAGRHLFGRIDEDDLYLDGKTGRVWRLDADSGELLEEGSRLHRWLLGFIEGERAMYDADGEFAEDVFGDDGRPTPEFLVRKERRVLKRDKDALGPRWRLARALSQQDRLPDARNHLERVVEVREEFSWAWYDLARISEALGETSAAIDEMNAAATADPTCEYRGFFYAHCARLSASLEDEDARKSYAHSALQLEPHLVRSHLDGACERLDAGDPDGAGALVELALAIAPLDLAALDLRVQVEAARANPRAADDVDDLDEAAEDAADKANEPN